MLDLSQYPLRVRRAVAMRLLCIENDDLFKKVVDATPGLAHKLPGETNAKYLTSVIAKMLSPNDSSRCATEGEVVKRQNKDGRRKKSARTSATKPKRTS